MLPEGCSGGESSLRVQPNLQYGNTLLKAIAQTGPREAETQHRDRLSIGADQMLVNVHATGRGSSVHADKYDGGYELVPIPRFINHEYSGKLVEAPIHDCG